MIIFPTLTLSALAVAIPSSNPTLQALPSVHALDVLCYDTRYATHRPTLWDCTAIINHQIAKPPTMARNRVFSRHPTARQLLLPHSWVTERGECSVTIDIPDIPGETERVTAEASMMDVKRAAFEVLMACVVGADHLGGFMQTGRTQNLQVRVEAADGAAS